jgi:RNA polymerase sigma-70 factor (ECF subfamily)
MGQKLADLGRYHSRVKRGAGAVPLSLEMMAQEKGGNQYSLLEGLASNYLGPPEVAVGREQKAILAQVLAQLPEDEARVLWLYHVDGLSFEAIGKHMSRGRKTVRAMWLRGLRKVRRDIGEACDELDESSAIAPRHRVPLEIPA